MLLVTAAIYFVSEHGPAVATGWYALLVFRFLGGIGIGAASVIAPMYIAEISPARLLGRLVAVSEFNIVIGVLIAFFSNYLLVGIGADSWRWMFGVMTIPSAIFFILLFVVPEIPRWLVKMGKPEEARAVLQGVGAANVESELDDVTRSLKNEGGTTKLIQKKYGYVIILAVVFAFFAKMSGINVVMY